MQHARGLKDDLSDVHRDLDHPRSRSDRHLLEETQTLRDGRLSTLYEPHSIKLGSDGGVPYVSE